MKQKKILPFAIGFVVILIAFLVVGKKAGWFGKEFAVSISTEKVVSKTLTELVTANGKIQPETEVKISPDVSGEIIELYVEEGDVVEKGQMLCIIKPEMYESALNRAEAALNSSKARMAQSEAQFMERELAFKRAKQLYENGAIPVSEYESAEVALKVAQAEVTAAGYSVKSSEASVREAREELTKTKIYAPIAGTISTLKVKKGERVVGTNMYEGTEMMRIANLDRMEVMASVNENDIVKVERNDTALIEVDAYLNRKFKGIVTKIANSASTTGTATDQVTNFDVKIFLLAESYADLTGSLPANMSPFRPGMSATVDIQTETRNNVITVPISAVTTRVKKEGGGTEDVEEEETTAAVTEETTDSETKEVKREEKQEVVFVVRNGRVFKAEVKTGIQDNNNIEILEGLSVGDEVVTAPYSAINRTLKDSMAVKIVTQEELFKTDKK